MQRKGSILFGAFMLGALIVLILFVVFLAQYQFWVEKTTFVLNFENSVSGLSEGAPVQFQGVRVGRVTDIRVVTDPEDMQVNMPVYIEIDSRRIQWYGGNGSVEELFSTLLDRGLRARIRVLSYITGQRMVELSILPDSPKHLAKRDLQYPEIPTVPSKIQEVTQALEDVPLEQLLAQLTSAVQGLERTINSPELSEGLKAMNSSLQSASGLLSDLEKDVPGITEQLDSTLGEAQGTIQRTDRRLKVLAQELQESSRAAQDSFNQLETTLDLDQGRSAEIASSLDETLQAARSTLRQTESALAVIEGAAAEDSDLRLELAATLQNVSSAARSIRSLASYLERNPESLIRGKRGP
ncbi:MAG: MlaD family protein [Thermodesulfobacteriota bacterium]